MMSQESFCARPASAMRTDMTFRRSEVTSLKFASHAGCRSRTSQANPKAAREIEAASKPKGVRRASDSTLSGDRGRQRGAETTLFSFDLNPVRIAPFWIARAVQRKSSACDPSHRKPPSSRPTFAMLLPQRVAVRERTGSNTPATTIAAPRRCSRQVRCSCMASWDGLESGLEACGAPLRKLTPKAKPLHNHAFTRNARSRDWGVTSEEDLGGVHGLGPQEPVTYGVQSHVTSTQDDKTSWLPRVLEKEGGEPLQAPNSRVNAERSAGNHPRPPTPEVLSQMHNIVKELLATVFGCTPYFRPNDLCCGSQSNAISMRCFAEMLRWAPLPRTFGKTTKRIVGGAPL